MKIVFLGPPGVGKGTIADMILAKHPEITKLSTGDLFRENIQQGTPLGKKAQEYMNQGKLVPDELVIDMVKDKISGMDNFILDGFPRTVPQAESLGQIANIDKVINFIAKEEIILQRLGGRRTCPNCKAIFHVVNMPTKKEGICDNCGANIIQRDDDKEEAIKKRLVVYDQQTKPLINYYKEKNMLVDIDAAQPVRIDIAKDTAKAMDLSY